jgi:hypothetical protein
MTPGPLRRLAGGLGLLALAPTAWLLGVGGITLMDAAVRAAVTLAVVVVVGRLTGWVVAELAGSMERSADGDRPVGASVADQAGTAGVHATADSASGVSNAKS